MRFADGSNGVHLFARGQPLGVHWRVGQEEDERDGDDKGQDDTDDVHPLPRVDVADKRAGVVVEDQLIGHHGQQDVGEAARRPPEELHPRTLLWWKECLVKHSG